MSNETMIALPVVIDKVSEVKTNKNNKKYQEIDITQLDTGAVHKNVKVYLGEDGSFDYSVGQEIVVPLTGNEWKGKTYYSAGVWECALLGPEQKANIKVTPAAVEQKKEREPYVVPDYQSWFDGKFKRYCDILGATKDMSAEFQQAIAKEIPNLIK